MYINDVKYIEKQHWVVNASKFIQRRDIHIFQISRYTLRPRQDRRHFADDIFKSIFLNKNVRISLKISLTFVPKVRVNNILALVQIMARRRPGDKPLSGPMMVSLLTHICITRPQWVKTPISVSSWSNPLISLYICCYFLTKYIPIVQSLKRCCKITIVARCSKWLFSRMICGDLTKW